ncbi:hypothetical protein [Nonomuraea endophytica]|uniref:hypothetical protein n=1 Tax=Nonomuraea endophytica TaxID=714136 RepID=UPI0037CBEBD9
MDEPPPMDVRTACIVGHEYFTSLLEAGFAPGQALYLTACILSGGPKPPMAEGGGASP